MCIVAGFCKKKKHVGFHFKPYGIQDLNDIAVLGRENPDPLAAIEFDLTQLNLVAAHADELDDLLAEATGAKANPNASKITRDKAHTHMKALVDEIRKARKYVFRNNKTG